MRLEDIGFYTLSDQRAKSACHTTSLHRCEIVLTSRCNFSCPYCRSVGGNDLSYEEAARTVKLWAKEGLKNIRFSGGEPTLWKGIFDLVLLAKELGIERIALSTNGSASQKVYQKLLDCGVNDFSVSLDACCAEDGDKMAGGVKGAWDTVVKNIQWLNNKSYVTVGVVLTEQTMDSVNDIIKFAASLGVSDVRIIPAAQDGNRLKDVFVDKDLMDKFPILKYRINNLQEGKTVRGLKENDSCKCGLALDDMAVNQGMHYPCIIYMREMGKPIGKLTENVRKDRLEWYNSHDTHKDPICKTNCLDVCVDYNNRFEETNIHK